MAAIDGIENKIHPGDPLDKDIYHLTPAEYETIGTVECVQSIDDDLTCWSIRPARGAIR